MNERTIRYNEISNQTKSLNKNSLTGNNEMTDRQQQNQPTNGGNKNPH